jgi:hypothetical protein
VDPGLYGCMAALVWALHRHRICVPRHVARHRQLGRRYRQVLGITRFGALCDAMAVFAVAIAKIVTPMLPGPEAAVLYLAGVGTALGLLVLVEASVFGLRRAIAREAAQASARRERARSVHTMMRLGLGPHSEQLY